MVSISNPKNLYLHYKESGPITRANVTAIDLFVLPKGSKPISIFIFGEEASDAGTAAIVAVGITGTSTYFHAGLDVKNAGHVSYPGGMNNGLTKLTADTVVTGVYAEAGTASTEGGPWKIGIMYTRD